MGTIITGLVLVLVAGLITARLIVNHKKGKHCCSGECGKCDCCKH